MTAPRPIPSSAASHGLRPDFISSAALTAVRPNAEPTERSSSRMASRYVIEQASRPIRAAWLSTSVIWRGSRKLGSRMPTTATRNSVEMSTPRKSWSSTCRVTQPPEACAGADISALHSRLRQRGDRPGIGARRFHDHHVPHHSASVTCGYTRWKASA
jgi:hypothetical protein